MKCMIIFQESYSTVDSCNNDNNNNNYDCEGTLILYKLLKQLNILLQETFMHFLLDGYWIMNISYITYWYIKFTLHIYAYYDKYYFFNTKNNTNMMWISMQIWVYL